MRHAVGGTRASVSVALADALRRRRDALLWALLPCARTSTPAAASDGVTGDAGGAIGAGERPTRNVSMTSSNSPSSRRGGQPGGGVLGGSMR